MKPGEKFDRHTLKALERFLKERHAELTGTVHYAAAQPCTHDGDQPADPLEWASNKANDAIQLALLDCHRRQAAQIEEAIRRLARGEYGICQTCGSAIGLERLQALPFAQRCAPCQARAELRAPHRRRPVGAVVAAGDGR